MDYLFEINHSDDLEIHGYEVSDDTN